MKKFTKKELMERLDFAEDEAKLIVKAQAQFPELLTLDESEEFVIDARNLWRQLGEPNGRFNDWIKRKVIEKTLGKDEDKIFMFTENKDYEVYVNENGNNVRKNAYLEYQGIEVLDGKRLSQLGCSIEYKLSIECGKMVAMMENTHAGTLCRRYFILMEKAVKKMSDWLLIRNPQKQGYKDMSKAVRYNYMQLHNGEEPNQFIYINNADMVNLALLGHKSKAMKELLEVQYDDALRDHVTLEVNKALYELQQLNENLLYSNVDFKTRKMIIETTVRTKYTGLRIRFTSEFAKELSLIRD